MEFYDILSKPFLYTLNMLSTQNFLMNIQKYESFALQNLSYYIFKDNNIYKHEIFFTLYSEKWYFLELSLVDFYAYKHYSDF